MKLRCLVVDDEALARRLLEENIKQIPFLEFVKSCKNPFEALEALQTEQIDLMFLDIQMPGMLGTKFLAGLREKPLVILVTAYANYAVESYELDVVDYLMKPVSMERFMKACVKARDLKYPTASNHNTGESSVENSIKPDYFFVNVEYALVRVNIPDITYIEGMKDYIKVFLDNNRKPVITKMSMKAMEEKLMGHHFFRVHKSYIVNLKKIEAIRNQEVIIGQHEIPVSETNLKELMRLIHKED